MSNAAVTKSPEGLKAEIRDLRYHPYDGPRREGSRAWVIALAELGRVKKSKWTKWLAASSLSLTAGYGLAMYLAMKVKAVTHGMVSKQTMPPGVMKQLLTANRYVADAILINATVIGFFVALIAAGPAIADDLKGGGLHFHFSRPVTTWDYVLGKILPTALAVWVVTLIPAMALGLLRTMLSPSGESLSTPIGVLGRGLLLSATASVSMAVPAVAMSAFTKRKGVARLLWTALFLLSGAAGGVAVGVTKNLQWSIVSLSEAVKAVGYGIFSLPWPPRGIHRLSQDSASWTWGLLSVAVYVVLGLTIVVWRVSKNRRSAS